MPLPTVRIFLSLVHTFTFRHDLVLSHALIGIRRVRAICSDDCNVHVAPDGAEEDIAHDVDNSYSFLVEL